QQGGTQFFQDRLPVLVRLLLLLFVSLRGGHQLGLDPPPAYFLESEALPGRITGRIDPQYLVQMRGRLSLQAVLLAPDRQLPLIVGPVGRPGSAMEILLDEGLARGVVLKSPADLVRAIPPPPVSDQSQESPGQDVGLIVEDRQRKVLQPFPV